MKTETAPPSPPAKMPSEEEIRALERVLKKTRTTCRPSFSLGDK